MKLTFTIKSLLLLAMLIFISVTFSFAQAPDWNTHGTRADSSSLLGTSTYEDLRIITDSTVQMTVTKDGNVNLENNLDVQNGRITTDSIAGVSGNDVNILNNLNVTGTIKADSLLSSSGDLKINTNLNLPDKWIHADSLRVRTIHVGDSSIWIGGFNQFTGPNNTIATDNGNLFLQPITGQLDIRNGANVGEVGIGMAPIGGWALSLSHPGNTYIHFDAPPVAGIYQMGLIGPNNATARTPVGTMQYANSYNSPTMFYLVAFVGKPISKLTHTALVGSPDRQAIIGAHELKTPTLYHQRNKTMQS